MTDSKKCLLQFEWQLYMHYHKQASSLCFKRNKKYGIILFCIVGIILCVSHGTPLKLSIPCVECIVSYVQAGYNTLCRYHAFILWPHISLYRVHNALVWSSLSKFATHSILTKGLCCTFKGFLVPCTQVRIICTENAAHLTQLVMALAELICTYVDYTCPFLAPDATCEAHDVSIHNF